MRIEVRFSFVTKEYRKEGRESGAIKEKPC
jgi:hypothetical protein